MPGGKIDILVEPDLKAFPSKLGAGLRAASGVASAAGAAIGVAIAAGSVAAAAGLKQVIDLGIQYQDSLNTFQAVTGATGEQMAQVGATAKELGSDLTLPATSAVDAAAAMTELAKGGLSVEQAMTAAKGTLQLAAAAQIDAASAAQIQSNALNTFGLAANQAGHVADVLANSANAASGEITDFAAAFQQGGAVAAQFGVSIEDTATELALLANRGIQGSDAGTLLKSTLLALTDTGKPAQAAIRELGLTVFDATGKFVGLKSLNEQLAAASKTMTQEQYAQATATLFGSDAVRFAGVAAATTSGQWDTMSAAVGKAGGAAEVAAAKTKGVGGALEAVKSQLETIGLTIFSTFAGPLEQGLRLVATVLDEVGGKIETFVSSGGLEKFATDAVASITAFAASWGVTWDGIVAFATDAFGKIRTVASNIGQALEPVITGFVNVFQSLRTSGVLDGLIAGLGLLGNAIVTVSGFLVPIGQLIGGLLDAFASLPGPIQTVILTFAAMKGLPAIADALGTSIGKLVTTSGPLGTVLGAAIDGVIGGFSRAGTAAKNSVSGIRQFSDEMKLQRALAEQAGQSLTTYEAAQAAFETSTVGSVESLRELRDTFAEVKAGAEGAGEPISNLEAAVATLAEHNQTIADLRDSYVGASTAAADFGAKVQAAAEQAAQGLSDKLVNATNLVADGIRSIPGKIAGVGGAIADAFRAGVEFIGEIPGKAAAAGEAITSGIGDAFQGAADFIGEFGGQIQQVLSGLGPRAASAFRAVGSAISTGFTSAVGAIRSFGTSVSTAFTGIVTAVSGIPARITGAISAIRTGFTSLPALVTGALTSMRTGIAAFGTAMQSGFVGAFRAIPGIVAGATGSLTSFASRVAGIGATIGTGLVKGIGGLVNILGGPLGLALIAAQFGLQALAKSQQQAAQAAQEHQARIQGLKGTLDQYTGAVTQATVAEQAKDIAARKLSDGTTSFATAMRGAGIDLRDFTEAASGNQEKLQLVNGQLLTAAKNTPALGVVYQEFKKQLDGAGISYDEFAAAAIGNTQAFDDIIAKTGITASGVDYLRGKLAEAVGPVGELGSALGAYSAEITEASEQQRIAGQAAKDFGAILTSIAPGLLGLKDGAAATAVLAAGFRDLAETAGNAATRSGQAAEKIGGIKAGAEAAAQSMQKSRDSFIEAATAAGLTAEQAAALADQIGLIPAAARTNFETNATGVTAELNTLAAQFAAIPDAKQITVNALSDDAKKKLTDLGFTVKTLPNGQVVVDVHDEAGRKKLADFLAFSNSQTVKLLMDADPAQALGKIQLALTTANASVGVISLDGNPTQVDGKIVQSVTFADGSKGTITLDGNPDPATGQINATVTYADGSKGTITVNANTAAAMGAINAVIAAATRTVVMNIVAQVQTLGQAAGGIVAPMAEGGVVGFARGGMAQPRKTRKMRGGIAQVVAPNTWRIIGDRIRDDEAYIPINNSHMSRAIFEETARRMGYAVTRQFADGGFAQTQARALMQNVAARALNGGAVDVAPIAAQLAQLRADLTSVRREVAITNQFFTEPAARDSDTVARTQRRQAALGLFG